VPSDAADRILYLGAGVAQRQTGSEREFRVETLSAIAVNRREAEGVALDRLRRLCPEREGFTYQVWMQPIDRATVATWLALYPAPEPPDAG
jgi:hypothetical protein